MKNRDFSSSVRTVLVVIFLLGMAVSARAEVNVNINVGTPPVVLAEPPVVVMAPGAGVYFVPNSGPDLFFYAGYWWSPRGDRWYRAGACKGPWVRVERHHVPARVARMPRDYRVRYANGKHVPYGQWKKTHYQQTHDHGRHGDHGDKKHQKDQKMSKKGHGHDD